jgi:putative nucleotidyltransferase with HDIG domain/PAS domain S-box-containing protein
MNPIFSPYALIMIAAAIICLSIAVYVWPRRHNNSETVPLTLLLLGISEWIFASLLGLTDQNLAHKILWAKFEYIGVVSVPLAVLGYVLYHSGHYQKLTRKRLAWLALIPAVTLILAWTNEYHGLIWARYVPYLENGLAFSEKTYGLGFWVYWGYSYLILLTATIVAIRLALGTSKLFRWQSAVVVVGILMPWAGNIMYVLHIDPLNNLDLTPLAFGVTGIMLAIGMFRWQLFDIKPIAQAAAIAGMADGLMILDNQSRILDVNPAAQVILNLKKQEMIGKQMEQVVADWRSLEKRPAANGRRVEIKLKSEAGERVYELSDSPFYEKTDSPGGMIVFLHDATNRKHLEEKLKEVERKHAEALLQQAENKYAILYQNMSVGVIYQNADGQVIEMNPAAERILGVGVAQFNDAAWMRANFETIREDGADLPVEEYPSMVALKTGKPMRNQLIGVYFPNERDYHWIIVNAVPEFKPGEDKPFQVFVTFDDVTERKRAELEQRVSLEIMQGLAYSMDLQEFLSLVHLSLGRVVQADNFFVALYNASSELFEEVYSVDQFNAPAPPSRREKTLTAYIFHTHEPFLSTKERFEQLVKCGEVELVGTDSLSFLGVPLIAYGQPIGVLAIQDYERENLYNDHDLQFLMTIAGHVALAIQRKQADDALQEGEEALRNRNRMLLANHQVMVEIGSELRLPNLLSSILAQAQSMANADRGGGVYLKEPGEDILKLAYGAGINQGREGITIQIGKGVSGCVYQTSQALVIDDYTHWKGHATILVADPPSTVMGVPLFLKSEVIGVLTLIADSSKRKFTAQDVQQAEMFAAQTAVVIQNAQLYQQAEQEIAERKQVEQALRQHLAELETLYESGLILSQITNPEEIAQKLISLMAEKLEWHHVVIRRHHPEDGRLELLAFSHPDLASDKKPVKIKERFQTKIRKVGDGLTGWVAQHGVTVRCGELTQDSRYVSIWPGLHSGLYVPMKIGDEIMGVISIESELPNAFSEADERLITTLAAQAAITLDDIRLFEDLQSSNNRIIQAYDDTIQGWSKALDLRDKETEGHTLRVTTLTEELARQMGIPETEIVHIRRGALLHDIGKMGVPDRILLKPDRLSDEEWVIMREHPVHAYNLLSTIEFLHPALNIPHYHHERWDGSGYPEGLKGEQIPIEARIFAIIDVYDALTSDRPYRPGWPHKRAIKYIREQSGCHFDPKVVAAFIKLIDIHTKSG